VQLFVEPAPILKSPLCRVTLCSKCTRALTFEFFYFFFRGWCTCFHSLLKNVLTYIHTYIHMYVYIYVYLYIYTHTYIYIYIKYKILMCVYMYTHTHTHTHTSGDGARVPSACATGRARQPGLRVLCARRCRP
jgi:hypothetical protein